MTKKNLSHSKETYFRVHLYSFCFFLFLAIQSSSARAATAIGNGGDVLDHTLSAVRGTILEAFRFARNKKSTENLCTRESHFNLEQKITCREFIEILAAQVEPLLEGENSVPFLLSKEPLTVLDPDGKTRNVLAMTPTGTGGAITFYEPGIRFLPPRTLLALMLHEFGHKVTHPLLGRPLVDEDKLPGFLEQEGARHLLDGVGSAMAQYAIDLGLMGENFEVDDHFSCHIVSEVSGIGFTTLGYTKRLFLFPQNQSVYETGIGNSPRDLQCELTEEGSISRILVQLKIHEPSACQKSASTESNKRWSHVQLKRIFNKDLFLNQEKEDEILEEKVLENYNPLCLEAKNQVPLLMHYSNSHGRFRFEVRYRGTAVRTY